ncbi:hypothetical protein AA313_de0204374 [Arthrobotrys entomopaga]|nr:hypothetical protein AA313_de0204374 [Arthrobotrys entomopaga]
MSEPTPGPAPVTKPTFPVEELPNGFADLTFEQKIDWLNAHGLESDKTVNLGDCYRRGAKLTHIFSAAFKSIKNLIDVVGQKSSASVRKYLNSFIKALKDGVGHLNNYIYANVTTLLKTGKFSDVAAATTPVFIPDLPTINDEEVLAPTPSKTFDTKSQGGDQPQDDESTSVRIIVSSAVNDGLLRRLGWRAGSEGDVPAEDDVSTILELEEIKELALAWERLR